MTGTATKAMHQGSGEESARHSMPHGQSPADLDLRWHVLGGPPHGRALLADDQTVSTLDLFRRNVEDMIGTVKVPVGVAGPLLVKGTLGSREFFVPLATTEATLVASYNRGSQLITAAGGCTARVVEHRVARAPGFAFSALSEVEPFTSWAKSQQPTFKRIAASSTRYVQLLATAFVVEGNHVYMVLQFSTADAAGQNMVTIATAAICNYVQEESPVHPHRTYVQSNLSQVKKASAQ